MIRRIKLVRAGLVRATARAIVRAVRATEFADEIKSLHVVRVRAVLRLGGPMHWFRSKTYIISTRMHHARSTSA